MSYGPLEVTTGDVKQFIGNNRGKFVADLDQITTLVSEALKGNSIYKIYGRDEKQEGEKLRATRKIRQKFNFYNKKHNIETASLWEVPDIIGFTIVVAYPSDINAVCRVIDSLIDDKRLLNAYSSKNPPAARESNDEKKAKKLIDTRYGRALVSDGYFACHYNVRTLGIGLSRPICEIQIKTVLHDAWGAKAHDLTYKFNWDD